MKVKDGESGIEMLATTPAIIRHNTIVSTTCTIDDMIVATIGELDQNIGITTDGTSGEFIKGGAISPEVVAYNLDHLAKTAVANHADMSTEITTSSILANIMTSDGNLAGYDRATDSLEAIYDKVAAYTDNVSAAVPDSPTEKSLQDILSELDGANTYDNTTDSLEAISNFVRTGITLGRGINLDYLAKTDTGVAAGGNLTTYAANGSLLSHILSSTKTTNTYDCQTDSLEAIADAIAAITDNITTAVDQTVTARSLHDILEKDNTGSFNDATDSLEAISDSLHLAIGDVGSPAAGSVLDILKKLYYVADGAGKYPATVVDDSALAKIMSKAATASAATFENDTDSLEAIRDNQQTAARAAIDDAELDHLCELDGATQKYPENAVNDSIIAKILCKGDPATISTYNCTTDSLEAIRDHLDGTTVLAGIQLDTLAGVATGVAADADLENHCVAQSLLSHLASVGADITTFQASTDSLEGIRNHIEAGTTTLGGIHLDKLAKTSTGVAAGAELDGSITALSILGHIMATDADPSSYSCATDSLQSIADSITAGTTFGAGINLDHLALTTTGVDADGELDTHITAKSILGHIMAVDADPSSYNATSDSLQAIGADADTILADTAAMEPGAERIATFTKTDLSGATGDTVIFTIANGPIRVVELFGIVTNTLEGAANFLYKSVPTSPGADVSISTATAVDNQAAGTTISTNATFGGATVVTTNGTIGAGCTFIQGVGTIKMNLSGNLAASDEIKFYIRYQPMLATAVVTGGA